jgi:hypothetical protein
VANAIAQLQSEITHLSSELNEEADQQKAVMVGMVAGTRTITTQKGDAMGFVQLEDVQGAFECVVFPRLWKQTQGLWQNEKIIMVRGTIDAKGRTPKVLLDSATDKPQVTTAREDKNARRPAVNRGLEIKDQAAMRRPPNAIQSDPVASSPQPEADRPPSTTDLSLSQRIPVVQEDDPFAGEVFDVVAGLFDAEVSTASAQAAAEQPQAARETTADYQVLGSQEPVTAPALAIEPMSEPVIVQPRVESAPAIEPAGNGNGHGRAHAADNGNGNGRHPLARSAKVIISRSGDGNVDAQRVGEVHQLMSSYPGPDSFCFIVMARGSTLQLDFPNDSTTLSDDLIAQLKTIPGVESVQVSMSL